MNWKSCRKPRKETQGDGEFQDGIQTTDNYKLDVPKGARKSEVRDAVVKFLREKG